MFNNYQIQTQTRQMAFETILDWNRSIIGWKWFVRRVQLVRYQNKPVPHCNCTTVTVGCLQIGVVRLTVSSCGGGRATPRQANFPGCKLQLQPAVNQRGLRHLCSQLKGFHRVGFVLIAIHSVNFIQKPHFVAYVIVSHVRLRFRLGWLPQAEE